MAPRETPKTPKVQRTIVKTSATKTKTTSTSNLKKPMASVKKPLSEKKPNIAVETRQRTSTLPKENKPIPVPGSVTKSAKKPTWNRRPKPAHSGVPVPEKMRKYLQKRLQDFDCSLIVRS